MNSDAPTVLMSRVCLTEWPYDGYFVVLVRFFAKIPRVSSRTEGTDGVAASSIRRELRNGRTAVVVIDTSGD